MSAETQFLAPTVEGEEDELDRSLRPRRLQRDVELLLDALLADELIERARPKRALELVLLRLQSRSQELFRHAAFSAWRTRSSGGASGSVLASARSASKAV